MCLLWGWILIFKNLDQFCNPKVQIILTFAEFPHIDTNFIILSFFFYDGARTCGTWTSHRSFYMGSGLTANDCRQISGSRLNVFVLKWSSKARRTAKHGLPYPLGGGSRILRNVRNHSSNDTVSHARIHKSSCQVPFLLGNFKRKYRVIHKSLRDFWTRLRNNQDRHGRKEHISR